MDNFKNGSIFYIFIKKYFSVGCNVSVTPSPLFPLHPSAIYDIAYCCSFLHSFKVRNTLENLKNLWIEKVKIPNVWDFTTSDRRYNIIQCFSVNNPSFACSCLLGNINIMVQIKVRYYHSMYVLKIKYDAIACGPQSMNGGISLICYFL